MFHGCIPIACGRPKLSYDDNNTISTFEVTFVYRDTNIGAVGKEAAKEWIEDQGNYSNRSSIY